MIQSRYTVLIGMAASYFLSMMPQNEVEIIAKAKAQLPAVDSIPGNFIGIMVEVESLLQAKMFFKVVFEKTHIADGHPGAAIWTFAFME